MTANSATPDALAPDASDYQKVRLWSGIFSIGANLGLIWALYALSRFASPSLLARADARVWLLAPVALMLALGLVFDILSGFATETALGRTRQSFKLWLRDWLLAASRVAIMLTLALWTLSWLRFQSAGTFALIVLVATALWTGITLLLPSFLPRAWQHDDAQTRDFTARLRPELERAGVPSQLPITWIQSEDETGVNGAMPPLGRALWLGTNVSRELSPRQAALMVRRDWWFRRTNKHALNALICVSWLALGLLGTRLVPAQDALQAGVGGAAWMTTWCFAALFVWPPLSQKWSREADRDLLQVASPDEIAELLTRVQSLNLTDTQLSRAKSTVFHPVPDLSRRLENLRPSEAKE